MASAAEPVWRTGAVGHERPRLAGGPRGRDLADQHDRRCDQPVVRSVCGQRLHGGEHESPGTLPEEAQAAAGVLHRQSVDLSNCGEDQTGRQPIGEEPGRVAPDADRPRSPRVGNPLDSGAQPAGQREGGARILDGAGPAGEGPAGGWSDDVGGSQPLPGNRVSDVGPTPAAKGRVERGFLTAQDRLVKGLRVAGVTTLEGANHYLETEFLPWVNSTLAVVPANPDDAHRPLEKQHDLAAILSHVEKRRVNADYTFPLGAKTYRIARQDISAGLRGAYIRVEQRRDGSVAACFGERYLRVERCEQRPKVTPPEPAQRSAPRKPAQKSAWNQDFDLKKGPKAWQAAQASGARREEP